jgi:predicted alpha/beta-fold hydrolase
VPYLRRPPVAFCAACAALVKALADAPLNPVLEATLESLVCSSGLEGFGHDHISLFICAAFSISGWEAVFKRWRACMMVS